jgi:EamA domain-containing membrane protein RarD
VQDDPRKYRNYVIAASVGGFLLPMVGLVGAFVFWSREDLRATKIIAAASFAGAVAYGILFGALA